MNPPFKTTEYVTLAVLLMCADLHSSFAQTAPGSAVPSRSTVQGDRNLLVQAVAATTALPAANQTQRVALVIGNAAYKDAPLSNPINDARAFAQALQESGFSVILRENTDQRGMLAALREFGDRLRAGGTGLFYYAGHGMQIKGRNYLIPIGANVEREDEIAYSTVDAQAVLDKMEAAGNPSNIMILDACRNNPFLRSSRGGQSGLSQMEAPAGTLVAFSTAPGAVASDGTGTNGLYTQHLLNAVRQPGSKVEDVFKQVRANVRKESQGKQIPWEVTSLEGDFYFKGAPAASAASSAGAASTEVETALWEAVRTSELALEVRAYLGRYPNGRYADLARQRLAQLQPALVTTAAPLPPPALPTQRVSTATAPTKPPGASNKLGFTTGDRWRYQNVDKYKGEVVANFSYSVDKILPNGDMAWNKGNIVTSPEGNFRRDVNNSFERRDYSQQADMVPNELRAGYKQDVRFTVTARRGADNFEFTEEYKGTLTVKGKEKIRVPAGEFEAYKVERITDFSGVQTNGNGRWYGHNTVIGWYVPELRNFVARDHEHRVGSSPPTRERVELTSFSVRGAETLAQR